VRVDLPGIVALENGADPRAVSTTRIFGFARRTGSPRNASIPSPFATKRSAEAIFFMSPGVRA